MQYIYFYLLLNFLNKIYWIIHNKYLTLWILFSRCKCKNCFYKIINKEIPRLNLVINFPIQWIFPLQLLAIFFPDLTQLLNLLFNENSQLKILRSMENPKFWNLHLTIIYLLYWKYTKLIFILVYFNYHFIYKYIFLIIISIYCIVH